MAKEMTAPILQHRIGYGLWYLQGLYKENNDHAVMAEGPGFPLSTEDLGDGTLRQCGFHFLDENDYNLEHSEISSKNHDADDDDYYLDFIRFDYQMARLYGYPTLHLKVHHYEGGDMDYSIEVTRMYDDPQKLYLADSCIDSNLQNNETWGPSVWAPPSKWRGYPQHRYAMRHGSRHGQFLFAALGDMTKSNKLKDYREDYGFAEDLYDPMYGQSAALGIDYFFDETGNPHRDCDFALDHKDGALPWGLSPHRYAYQSKSCINKTLTMIALRKATYLQVLQAIHALNKWGDPDHTYYDGQYNVVSARSVARDVEQNHWNGYGVPGDTAIYAQFPQNVSLMYSTACFSVLETLLGFKYYDATSRAFAKTVVEAAWPDCQWGVQYPHNVDGLGETDEEGVLRRNNLMGCALGSYKAGDTYPFMYTHDRGWLNIVGIADLLNMDEEYGGVLVGPMEAAATYVQAMRVYLHYAFGIDCPTSAYIP